MSRARAASALSALLFAGCAQVVVRHVSEADTSDGVHFYEPRPYLWIGSDAKGNPSSQIVWLPDPARRYVVKVRPGLGAVDGSVNLSDGWMLDSLGARSDTRIPETIAAVATLARAAPGLGEVPQAGPLPGLYRIDIDADGDVALVRQPGWP